MKAGHGHTNKHAGSKKHAGSAKHKPSAKQIAARKKFQQAGAHEAHLHAVARHASHAKPSKWSPGLDVASCALDALAASLRLTGHPVADEDVLALYWRLTGDPDGGVTLEQAIEGAATYGLAGVRVADARPATVFEDGVVLGVDLAERHALALDGHGVWTWGAWRPASCALYAAADEAWTLDWAVS
jgi:hypothetical protein